MSDDLRRFIDAHGKGGVPPLDGQTYVVQTMSDLVGLYVSTERQHGGFTAQDAANAVRDYYVDRKLFARFAPLPPLAGRFESCALCEGTGARAMRDCGVCGPSTHPLAAPGVRWVPTVKAEAE